MEHPRSFSADASVQYRTLLDAAPRRSPVPYTPAFVKKRGDQFTVIVDAMLGTSFRGALRGKYHTVVQWCNRKNAVRVAVDIPTGLNGETGEVMTDAFRADVTVTMSNPKSGFFFGRAKEFTGDVVSAAIGIPRKALPVSMMQLTGLSDIERTFPKRAVNSHKHSVGKIFVLAGSRSMMGAALLSSSSAMRSGAGQVILGIPESEYVVAAKRTLEVMPLPLPATVDGTVSMDALPEILRRMEWCDVMLDRLRSLDGMKRLKKLIRTIIKRCSKPMVIDADALTALASDMSILKRHSKRNLVLTPHVGEFSRMSGLSSKEIEQDPFSFAAHFAKEYRVSLVLKGAPSIVADPKGMISVNSTGNPGMSTAGSGDVLAGIIAALIGQGNAPVDAAINGVYIHGAAGDAAAEKKSMQGMIARDIISMLPSVIRKVTHR
jgi:hydroxyethylthiazole kinase-like uncharacterized protein yjeF